VIEIAPSTHAILRLVIESVNRIYVQNVRLNVICMYVLIAQEPAHYTYAVYAEPYVKNIPVPI